MNRPQTEWDPSWNDDWIIAQKKLEEEMEEAHPRNPSEAVEYYRYGFSAARKQPLPEWCDVESELYKDYMSGAVEPGEWEEQEMGWDQVRSWAHRGWEASHR